MLFFPEFPSFFYFSFLFLADFALAGSIIILLVVATTEVDKSKLPISEEFYLFNIITVRWL